MKILRFDPSAAADWRAPLRGQGAASTEVAEGSGEAHAYLLHFEPGGLIGPHEAGFGQIFFAVAVAVAGDGWAAGEDGERVPLAEGEAAFIHRGEVHSKGSETGMTALMIQIRDLEIRPGSAAE